MRRFVEKTETFSWENNKNPPAKGGSTFYNNEDKRYFLSDTYFLLSLLSCLGAYSQSNCACERVKYLNRKYWIFSLLVSNKTKKAKTNAAMKV